MKIKRLYINNYKSLVDFELLEPNPFSVFVGPNAAGKSNVFEALEFLAFEFKTSHWVTDLFETPSTFLNKQVANEVQPLNGYEITFKTTIDSDDDAERKFNCIKNSKGWLVTRNFEASLNATLSGGGDEALKKSKDKLEKFSSILNRIFIGNSRVNKLNISGDEKLRIDAANLEPVLHRILQDEAKRDEITEWIEYLVPGLEKVEVAKSDLSGDYFLRIFEKNLPGPIGKNLISDGTYNILALLTAVYQSDEPQFLCIEEPENGITPYVQRALVNFFRTACKEKGHSIWLNTHSPTIVNELQPKELILIDKVEGITKAKQLDPNLSFKSMKLDEAWLTNSLGGGLPW